MDSESGFVVQKLNRSHDKVSFDCGESSLNHFLHKYARQNLKKGLGTTYVATRRDETGVVAYYTISSGQVAPEVVPKQDRKSQPRYPIPVIRIGRLAFDKGMQGKGLGRIMLVDALRRACTVADALGVYAIEVDALTEKARRFYERVGFKSLIDDLLHLYLPIQIVRKLFE